MEHGPLLDAIYYLAAAVIAVPIFSRLGFGSILGYLIAGVCLGPSVLAVVHDPQAVLHVAEIGVVLLLFLIGLELNPAILWQMRKDILFVGLFQLLFSALMIGLIAKFGFGLGNLPATIIGLALGLSSTAFVIQLMSEDGILGLPAGRKGFAILLLQDLAVIPILLLVQSAAVGEAHQSFVWWQAVAAILAVLLMGRYLLNPLLSMVAGLGLNEVMTALALLIVLGTGVAMQAVGLSMGMGAFVAGVMLANSSFRHQLEAEIDPFKGLLLGLFFISIGMVLDLSLLFAQPVLIISLALALMAIKALVVAALLRRSGLRTGESFKLGLMLSQGGEFAFVVMTHALSGQVLDADTAGMLTLVVGLSMAFTSPALMIFNRSYARWVEAPFTTTGDQEEPLESEIIIAGFGRFGQVTGRMLAANHIPFTALDNDAEHIDFVRRFGNKTYYGDATKPEILEAAGIHEARVLLVAIEEHKEALHLVQYVRGHFPDVIVIARPHNRTAAVELKRAGAHHVIREVFDGAIEAAENTLAALGFTESEAIRKTEIFREHDQRLLNLACEQGSVGGSVELDTLVEIGNAGRQELEQRFKEDADCHR